MDERLAVRQRQAAEAEAKRLEATEKEEAALAATAATADKGTMEDAKADESSPGEVAGEATAADATTTAVTTGAATSTTTADTQGDGREQVGATSADAAAGNTIDAAVATVGAAGADLPAIMEETPEPGLGADGVETASDEKRDERGESEPKLQEKENTEQDKDHSSSMSTEPPAQNHASQSEVTLREEASQEENKTAPQDQQQDTFLESAAATAAAAAASGGSDENIGRMGRAETDVSPARKELAKQREDIALLREQAKEGMTFVKQSIDMADVLRGFVFTRHGVPVRDPAISRDLQRDGRSTLRERFEFF